MASFFLNKLKMAILEGFQLLFKVLFHLELPWGRNRSITVNEVCDSCQQAGISVGIIQNMALDWISVSLHCQRPPSNTEIDLRVPVFSPGETCVDFILLQKRTDFYLSQNFTMNVSGWVSVRYIYQVYYLPASIMALWFNCTTKYLKFLRYPSFHGYEIVTL